MDKITACYLKCIKNLHAPILLMNEQEIIIGRCPLTNITDIHVSRKQVSLTAHYASATVNVKRLGENPSVFNGKLVDKNKSLQIKHNEKIELLEARYLYKISFEPEPIYMSDGTLHFKSENCPDMKKKVDSVEGCSTTEKRRCSSGDSEQEFKRLKTSVVNEPKNMCIEKENVVATDPDCWESLFNGELLVFTKSGVNGSSKIAAYDLDGTLIKTKSGLVFAKDIDDWQIAFGQIPNKLNKLEQEGYKIVIFTNQSGIGRGKIKVQDFKSKVEKIIKKLNVKVQVFISTSKGKFRKPMIGMWTVLAEQKNNGIEISKVNSFYCGDAAGRPDKWAPKKKKDFSASDRLMAENLEIPFYTPEEHFQGLKAVQWVRPEFDIKLLKDVKNSRFDPPDTVLVKKEQEVIILVGYPGSGKSFISQELVQSGYIHINMDSLGSWQKCIQEMQKSLKGGKSVVVDNTNSNAETRKRYISAAGKVAIRCGIMTTSFHHSRHNIVFRELTDKKHSDVPITALYSYRKNFQEPSLSEGFSEIFKINFTPKFDSEETLKLYYLHLLDK